MPNQVRKYQVGATIFREGEFGDCAYLVRDGKFEIYRISEKGHTTIAFAGPQTFFGELALIDGGRRMASARCVETGYVVLIDRARFLAKLEALTPHQRRIFEELLRFVREEPLWISPRELSSPSPLTESQQRVVTTLPKIEHGQVLSTDDNLLNLIIKTVIHYVKLRLPPHDPVSARGVSERTADSLHVL